MTRRVVLVVAVGLLQLTAACTSGSSSAPGEAGGRDRPPVTSSPADRLAAAQAGAAAEIERLSWPESYRPTIEGLTPKLGDPDEILLTAENGAALANIWNLCAWLREGVDRIEVGAPPTQLEDVAAHIDEWAAGDPDASYYAEFSDGIRTGDPTSANEYIAANDCGNFPS